jgi:Tfp pilus assembly protein PilO
MTHKSTKIIAGVSAVIFCVCMSMIVVALFLVTKQKHEYLDSLKKRNEEEARMESNKRLLESLEQTKSERALLATQILQDADVIGLLSLIGTLGKEQGVVLTTSSLNVEKIDQKFETLVVNLEATGSYTAVTKMLSLLEHIPYQASVSSVQLERTGEGEEGKWKGVFTVRITKFKKNEI